MKLEAIEKILAETVPNLDEDVKSYILDGVLSDPDSFQDLDTLRGILLGFIENEDCTNRMMEAIKFEASSSSTSKLAPETGERNSSVRLQSSSLATFDNPSSEPSLDNKVTPSLSMDIESSSVSRDKQARRQRKQNAKEQRRNTQKLESLSIGEAKSSSSALDGKTWGGRGKGGRGEYAAAVNSVKSNIHLSDVSLLLDNGLDLLRGSPMDIVKGHRYGLIGRNGVGKSTLLRRLADKAIPGMPPGMRILLVQQQVDGTNDSCLGALLKADTDRTELLKEQQELEARLESDDAAAEEIEAIAGQLEYVITELDRISAASAEERALAILRGLQFTEKMIYGPTRNLSGGWRMRLSLAQALLVASDLILFDECTNHLDLSGLNWIINYLNADSDRTLIVVSHDTMFLDAVCTDIVVLEHQRLTYHTGSYSEYTRQVKEKTARESQILDAAERQRTSAQAFIQKQQANAYKKSADPNKQRQAKMMKEKKLERIGNYREDGKRYKNFSLATLSEESIRLAQKVQIEVDEPIIKMHFPNPSWPPGISEHDALVRFEGFAFGYDNDNLLLKDVTIALHRGSKAALVGVNGAGKSSLIKLIAGDIAPGNYHSKGVLWAHSNVRIGHVTQYAVEELENFSELTVVEYAEQQLRASKVASAIAGKAAGNIRQYLGAFGLGGRHALQKIKQLSGGERMRLCFATVLAGKKSKVFTFHGVDD
jgi:ATP-binding cassette subfamily F protein 3